MRPILVCLPIAVAFIVTGCNGGSGSPDSGSAAGIPFSSSSHTSAVATMATNTPLYSIIYLPLDSGCRINEPAQLAQSGAVGVDELCPNQPESLKDYVYDHGVVTHLNAAVYSGIGGINSSDELITSKAPGISVFHNLHSGVDVPLAGDGSYAASINDSGYAAGDVCTVQTPNGCSKFGPALFAPTGHSQLLSSQAGNSVAINRVRTVAWWSLPNSSGTVQSYLFENGRTVRLNDTVGPSVEVVALDDDNDALVTVSQPNNGGPWKSYLVTGTHSAILIPPLRGGVQSIARAANTLGQVVGNSCDSTTTVCVADLYQRGSTSTNGTVVSLSSVSGATVVRPYAINNKGEIAVAAVHNGQTVPALLIPHGCVDP